MIGASTYSNAPQAAPHVALCVHEGHHDGHVAKSRQQRLDRGKVGSHIFSSVSLTKGDADATCVGDASST